MRDFSIVLSSPLPERAIALTSGIVLLAFLFFVSGRGFDVTDEGFYFLTATHPEDVLAYPGFGYVYASLLPQLGFETIRSSRLLLIGVIGIVGILFGRALYIAFVRVEANNYGNRIDPLIAASVGLHGALSYYTWTIMGPSYNYLVGGLTLMWISSITLGLVFAKKYVRYLFLGVAGVSVGTIFFIKASAGLGFLLFSLVAIGLWPEEIPGRVRRFVFFLAGGILWAVIHFTFFMAPTDAYHKWVAGYEAAMIGVTGHGPRSLIRYSRDISDFSTFLVVHYGPAIVCIFIAKFFAGSSRKTWMVFNLTAFAWVIQESVAGKVWLSGIENCINCRVVLHYGSWIIVALVALLPSRRSDGRALTLREWFIISTLLFAPVFAAVGTGNRIGVIIGMCLAPWIFLLFILASRLFTATPKFSSIVGTILCLLTVSQVTSAFIHSPYRLATGILEQSNSVPLRRGGTIQVDVATAKFWKDIQDAGTRCALTSDADVLGFFSVPGVVYGLGGRSPGSPWYISGYPGSKAYAEFVLSLVDRPRLKRAWILEAEGEKDLLPDLSMFNIDFPNGFELCGSAFWPFERKTIKLWKPR